MKLVGHTLFDQSERNGDVSASRIPKESTHEVDCFHLLRNQTFNLTMHFVAHPGKESCKLGLKTVEGELLIPVVLIFWIAHQVDQRCKCPH